NPVRLGKNPAATFDGLVAHVDAPVAFGIDIRVGISQNVADVAPEIQHNLLAPIRLAQLRREVGELPMLLRDEGQPDSPLIDGVQPRAASSRACSDEMRHQTPATARSRAGVSRSERMDLSMTVIRSRSNPKRIGRYGTFARYATLLDRNFRLTGRVQELA